LASAKTSWTPLIPTVCAAGNNRVKRIKTLQLTRLIIKMTNNRRTHVFKLILTFVRHTLCLPSSMACAV